LSGGELIMADAEHLIPAQAGRAVESCWLCGTRMPADRMLADGGSACANIRWYCLDTAGCTERWTRRPRAADFRTVTEEPPQDGEAPVTDTDAEQAPVWRPPAARAG
jgi:hypothetical protein